MFLCEIVFLILNSIGSGGTNATFLSQELVNDPYLTNWHMPPMLAAVFGSRVGT